MIMRWPAVIAAGTVIDEPITSPDFYPTLLSVAGLPPRPEQHLDGVDVSPLLYGEEFRRGPVYWHYPHYSNQGGRPSAAIRDGDLKLIHHFEDGACELYDLATDLSETTNLVDQRPDDVARLLRQLRTWMDEVGAVVPQPNPYPEPFADLASYYLHSELTEPDPRDRWVSPDESAAGVVEN